MLYNLSIGVLYAWSVLKSQLVAPIEAGGFGWSSAEAGMPYTTAIVFFSLGMLVGGIVQDRIGPRKVVVAGSLLMGAGLVGASLVGDSVAGVTVLFGVVCASGIGAGYSCISPCVLKWFPPSKKGLVAGLAVGGYGMAAVYLAPLSQWLLDAFGISSTLLALGAAMAGASLLCALFIENPPAKRLRQAPADFNTAAGAAADLAAPSSVPDAGWRQMVRTREFVLMFLLYALSSSVGLMVIGNMAKIATVQDPVGAAGYAALLVSLLAVFNTFGRVAGGMLSDRIGRANTLLLVFALQGIDLLLFSRFDGFALLVVGALLVGFSYGTLLAVFPTLTADLFGLKNYGMNYGIVYLSWGIAGVIAPPIADAVFDATGGFDVAYLACAGISAVCIVLGAVLKRTLRSSETR